MKDLIEGSFIERLNRFTVLCHVKGKRIPCYLPNPGRLWELLLPESRVFLKKSGNRMRFPYIVWAVEKNNRPVLLNTQFSNKVAEILIEEEVIPELKGFRVLEREVRIGKHRIDLLIGKGEGKFLCEVKSCTLFHGRFAMFPDAVTERGRRHVEALAKEKGVLLFMVFSPDVYYFLPDFHTDPAFARTLYRLRRQIKIIPVSLKWDGGEEFQYIRTLEIPWSIYEREAERGGSYIITGEMPEDKRISIGYKGDILFKKGYYLYVGSAMNSMEGRIKRHLRIIKNKRWHIDFLIPYLKDIKAIPIYSSERLECTISESLKGISNNYIEGFGSSDCPCRSHLYWMMDSPFKDKRFINLILDLRMTGHAFSLKDHNP